MSSGSRDVALLSAGKPDADPARRLRARYLLVLGLLAALILSGTIATRFVFALQASDAPRINLAGRQRMLSQRVVQQALRVANAREPGELRVGAAQLRQTLDEWSRGHRWLRHGNPARRVSASQPAELTAALDELDRYQHVMREGAERVLTMADAGSRGTLDRDPLDAALERIVDSELAYLTRMDRLVSFYEREASRRVSWLQQGHLTLTLASLALLVVAALLIFEPALRVIRRQFERATQQATQARRARLESERMAERLRASEARHRALAENANDLILEIDPRRRLHYVSPSHRDLLGSPPERFLGQDCLDFVHPDDHAGAARALARLSRHGVPVEFLARVRHRDGSWRYIEARARPYETDQGEPRAVLVGRDVTERKLHEEYRLRLEEQMRQSQKRESLGVLAGGIAHDFNNLLMALMGNVQLAQLDLPAGSPVHARLEKVLSAGRRAAELTSQMLTYAGREAPSLQPLDLCKLVEEMTELLRASVPKKVELECRLAADLPAIQGDPSQIRQIVLNLLINASEAIGEAPGRIEVRTGLLEVDRTFQAECVGTHVGSGEHVFLEVTDTGKGMDAETRARVFDPFFTTKFIGGGLGLAVVLGVVRSHRGAIRVRSEPDRGTGFTVVFPADFAAEVPRAESEALAWRQGQAQQGRVLVVDDESEVREVAASMLSRLGFRVLTARDGLEAVEVFRDRGEEIDLVLLDVTMPRMSGEEALRAMREIRSDARVVLMTGFDATHRAASLAADLKVDVLHKPFDLPELGRILETPSS